MRGALSRWERGFSNWERGVIVKKWAPVQAPGEGAPEPEVKLWVGDFGVGGGDLSESGVDVIGFDGRDAGSGGEDPGGLGEKVEGSGDSLAGFGEQVEAGGGEDVTVQTGVAHVPVEIGRDVLSEAERRGRWRR